MMKVFGIGLNKTGTKTLGSCLQAFGFRHRSYDPLLLAAFSKGDLETIYRVSDAYESFEDWPWPLLYREFDARYPDAKFILTIRKDPQTWFESLCRHADRTGPTSDRQIVYGYPEPYDQKEEHLRVYNRHNTDVSDWFAGREHRLLRVCWEGGDGWEKLAEFLGLPVPAISFPHQNKSRAGEEGHL